MLHKNTYFKVMYPEGLRLVLSCTIFSDGHATYPKMVVSLSDGTFRNRGV